MRLSFLAAGVLSLSLAALGVQGCGDSEDGGDGTGLPEELRSLSL